MQAVEIHLAEMAGWRALLTKAQFLVKLELHTGLEEYLVRMLFRAIRESDLTLDNRSTEFHAAVVDGPSDDLDELRAIGDHCLLFAGLFPEQAIGKNMPISYFVEVGRAAYGEFGRHVDEPVFPMLSEFFVDVMDVLQTLREVEYESAVLDPLNAFQLWQDTGSVRAWQILRRSTTALPASEQSTAVH